MENNTNNASKKEKNFNYFIPFIICLILLSASIIYIGIDKLVLSKNTQESQEKNKEEETTTVDDGEYVIPQINNPKCTGTYTGEYKDENNDLNYLYTLNSDSTFTANLGGLSGTLGTFIITGNTISLISLKENPGSSDVDPAYETVDYVIADDCSYINITRDNINFKLTKNE